MLPAPSKITKVQHHKAAEWKDISEIMKALQSINGMAAKAVRFCCLTAARSGEVRNAVWSEIDLSEALWVVPAEKMKAGREHRVPLSGDAVKVLQEVLPQRDVVSGDLLFPGAKRGRPLSDVAVSKALHHAAGTKEVTVHGLRSTFRDWAGETKVCSREVALAHAGKSKVEAAYFRSDLLDLRRPLMEEWAAQCRE
ncbi:phage integrase [Acetobacter senegalensis DSM 18889]|nr:phage integrase [Acetobacter senegalensis DSM 18889]